MPFLSPPDSPGVPLGQVGRGACLEVGIDELLAGALVNRHNIVIVSLSTRKEVTYGEFGLLVVKVVLEEDEAHAVSVGRSEERLERVPGLCGALMAGRDGAVGRVERERL